MRCSRRQTHQEKKDATFVATNCDELRTDVNESQENSLEAPKTAEAPDAKSVVQELDEADTSDGLTPGGEFIAEELVCAGHSAGRGRVHLLLLLPGPAPFAEGPREGRSFLLCRM